jgi:glycosyltransferase involved in cell wall biosynthesis
MKIVIAASLYPPEIDATAIYAKDLAEHLSTSHQVTVLTYAGLVTKPAKFNLLVVNKHQPLFFRLITYTYKLFFLAKKSDVIYVQNSVAAILPAILVKSILKTPVVINYSEDEAYKRAKYLGLTNKSLAGFLLGTKLDRQTKRIKNFQTWLLPQASKIVVPSKFLATLLEKFYKIPSNKIVINNQAIEKIEALPFAVKKIPHQIVATSDFVNNDSLKELLKALVDLKNIFQDIRLIIIGNGPSKEGLESLSRDLKLDESVIFLGQVSQAELIYYIKNSNLYFTASSQADFSRDILTSFLADTIVMASNIDWHREMIEDGRTGFLFEANSAQEIAEKIKIAFTDEQVSKNIIKQAKNLVNTKFTWLYHLSNLLDIFSSIKNK